LYKYTQVTGLQEDSAQIASGSATTLLIHAEAKNLGFKAPTTEKQHDKK